jgi:hypothetical protein
VRKQNAVYVEDQYVATDCIGSRNILQGTDLRVTMNRKSRVVPDGPRGNNSNNNNSFIHSLF